MSAIAATIAIEAIFALISMAFSQGQVEQANQKVSRETWIRSVFQTLKDAYGVTSSQVEKAAEQLGLKFNQVVDMARGSARNSTASKLYREFVSNYPQELSKLRDIQNRISKGVNTLTKLENKYASEVQSGNRITNLDVLKDVATTTREINTDLVSMDPRMSTSNIDTTLESQISQAEKQQETEDRIQRTVEDSAHAVGINHPNYWKRRVNEIQENNKQNRKD